MPTPVCVPKATISMEEATIVRWLKSEGEEVTKDEVLFEMETDKALLEVPAPVDGVLVRILIPEGTTPVESVVAWIREPGEPIENETFEAAVKPAGDTASEIPRGSDERVILTPPLAAGRTMATPAARRRAGEMGIELSAINGTGPGGRITEQDVEHASQASKAEKSTTKDQSRRTLAQHVTAAWQTIPHIHIAREIDGSGIATTRATRPQLSVTDLLLFALSRVLPRYELLAPTTDIAFAVNTSRGVVAPVIRNTPQLDMDAISKRRRDLALAVREQRIGIEDLQGGSFTLTNLGMEGVDFFAPIINAPQSAILATGALRRKPVFVEDAITVGWRMWANLALDHRVADGAYAAHFLVDLERCLATLPNECIGRNE